MILYNHLMEEILKSLNSDQKEAVLCTNGPVLVLAGPGTGKTHTIAARVAYLIREKAIPPEDIAVITFTNRAAAELRERISNYIDGNIENLLIGTFHRLGLKVLEELSSNKPELLTRAEQIDIIKEISGSGTGAQKILDRISYIKNTLVEPEDDIKEIYNKYQTYLSENNLLDLDDLILAPLKILKNNDLNYKKHIIIDEYQDINPSSHAFVNALLGKSHNLFAVGDPDQSIYSFRGSSIDIILRFTALYPGARIINLRQSYRSTKLILEVTEHIISKNKKRLKKETLPVSAEGKKVRILSLPDEYAEARFIAEEISRAVGATAHYGLYSSPECERALSDFAVLVRINSLIPLIEKTLKDHGIPARSITTQSLSSIPSIRIVLDYFGFLRNPHNDNSIKKIINTPKRGIGEKAWNEIKETAKKNNISIFEALRRFNKKEIIGFVKSTETALALFEQEKTGLSDYINEIITTFNLKQIIKPEELEPLFTIAYGLKNLPLRRAVHKLEEELLMGNIADLYNEKAEQVTIMSMHAAKGLEFPVVFVAAAEQGIVPYTKKDDFDIEEERRLFYVACTRAKEELIITSARRRTLYGLCEVNPPSEFLNSLPENAIERINVLASKSKSAPKQKSLF